jgi:hypothetical protein
MAWGILNKLNTFKIGHPKKDPISVAALAQARANIGNTPKWTSKPATSFSGANKLLGPGGTARPGATMAIGRPSGYRRSHMSDEEF